MSRTSLASVTITWRFGHFELVDLEMWLLEEDEQLERMEVEERLRRPCIP
jgi:hypothetical protein